MPDVSLSRLRPVRLWLLAAAAMIFLTLVVGGATRLTESGLSITEWKPVTGVLPPLSQAAWQAEFDGYKRIPQYRELNEGMSLDGFKTIYWWEWTHRLLARSVGMVFLLPFLFFLWRGMVPKHLQLRLWGIFAGGAALGAVGWWMVSSGLAGSDRVSVSQYRLAFHLTLACAIFAAILWTAQQLRRQAPREMPARLRLGASAIMVLVLLQIYLGALVAGSGAGLAYNTWPLIDGVFVPSAASLFHMTPAWRNLFENILTVQFDHRMVAYTIWAVAILHAIDAWRSGRGAGGALTLAVLVTAQAALGIVTLLYQVALPLALTHQMFAIVVFTVAIVHAERLSHREVVRMAAAIPTEQAA
ncbi:MAG TPA: COX15/CtaA family protein [Pseudolabrys sp.]|jgi:cytochrome c oxidase assembly protein subunit 15